MKSVGLDHIEHELCIFSCNDTYGVKTLMAAQQIPFQRVTGVWKGKAEYSFVVHPSTVEMVARAGFLDDQECVLYLEKPDQFGMRPAWFVYMSLAPEYYVGLFQRVHKPAPNEGYTYDHDNKEYWVIREDTRRKRTKDWAASIASIMGQRIASLWTKPVAG